MTEWPEGWLQVKVPLPFSLRWVNSYLIPDRRGYTLIDPGLHTPEAAAFWGTTMAEHQVAWQAIHTIVLTHQHPDHYGLAGWFQARTGAEVRMSSAALAYASELWGAESDFDARLAELYARHGMPERELDGILTNLGLFVGRVSPQPTQISLLEAGESILLGDRAWEMIDAPGHAYGQLLFYQRERRLILCGDQVLPGITPNISLVPGGEVDPLASFLNSLDELSRLPVERAFPGHRDPFADFGGRIAEIRAHHEYRLAEIAEWLTEPLHGYEICLRMFGERVGRDSHNLRFAMAETLAHLQHLAHSGAIVELGASPDGVMRYLSTDKE
ncbi:hypothetical protein PA598K_02286 [Paenibacillus sp. 598K]|uniref:MBL fold metallo-hydrolase n=1 Tax=Paenibacillus sp. 598K TaxID=1117987 RepID=UPI000FF9F1B0|nr:MBL fold metallo-hydrolase [Paenibacillus sp. 598K]GBF73960.1 hypothetical protein PA598K_02286 [Paenibacillus sp. 598K]